jgi:hypothetical protein
MDNTPDWYKERDTPGVLAQVFGNVMVSNFSSVVGQSQVNQMFPFLL